MIEERLRVLTPAEIDGRHVVRRNSATSFGPLFISWGQFNLLCGECGYLLMAKLPRGLDTLPGVAIECPNCSTINGV